MPDTTINGANLYFEARGPLGDPVVLVHGSWVDHHQWDAAAEGLAANFRVLTFDRRGHSLSKRPPSPSIRIDEDVMDLAALIEQQSFAPAHIAGNSFGAIIVLRLACQRPELVRSLIVHEPPLVGLLGADPHMQSVIAEVEARLSAVVGLLHAGDMRGGAERFVDTVAFGPGAWAQFPPDLRETFVANAQTFAEEVQESQAFDLDVAGLRPLEGPVLLTEGGQSPPFFSAIVTKLADALPQAHRVKFNEAGHVPHWSHPARYVSEVRTFILGRRAA